MSYGKDGRRINKVWIELFPCEENIELALEQCRLANKMLTRLYPPRSIPLVDKFFVLLGRGGAVIPLVEPYQPKDRAVYCYGGDFGYTILENNGRWFSLDYFGREGD